MDGDWEKNWQDSHNVVAAPNLATNAMKIHAWNANAWTSRRETIVKDSRKERLEESRLDQSSTSKPSDNDWTNYHSRWSSNRFRNARLDQFQGL